MKCKIIFLLLWCVGCYCDCGCTTRIPEDIRREYGNDFQIAFAYQAQGQSTHASYYFEQGCKKAKKAGESDAKIESIRQLFIWYRTYGYYLGLMTDDPNIFGQYLGNGRYSVYTGPPLHKQNFGYGSNPERDAKIRDYLFGVTEILSGILCLWLGPAPAKAAGCSLIADGGKRVWNSANSLWVEKDVSMMELQKKLNGIEAVAK